MKYSNLLNINIDIYEDLKKIQSWLPVTSQLNFNSPTTSGSLLQHQFIQLSQGFILQYLLGQQFKSLTSTRN